jgi:hypothetical protein
MLEEADVDELADAETVAVSAAEVETDGLIGGADGGEAVALALSEAEASMLAVTLEEV